MKCCEQVDDWGNFSLSLYFQIIILNLQRHDLYAIILPGKSLSRVLFLIECSFLFK